MNELPSELLSQMASYLWFKDLLSLSLTSKKIHHRLHSDGFFWIDLLDSILRSLYYDPPVHIRSDLLQLSQNYSTHDFVAFLKQILLTIPTFWPRTVDTKIFNTYRGPDHLRIIELENNPQRNYVLFDGSIDDGVRSIVANDCFPYLPIETDDLIVSLPFTKVVATELMTQQNGAETISLFTSGKVVCSEVGYFECMIHQSCFPPEALYLSSSQDLSSRTSISIGLACPPFALKGQFPGVDNFSLGYRSDDGAFYQGGYTGIQFGAEPYGPGDIVGCGLVYPPLDRQGKGKLFFTRNGHIQGRILDIASSNFFCIPWFPVIGIDCYYPVSMNFGQEPFRFDVLAYEQSLREVLCQPELSLKLTLSRLSPRVMKLYQENLSISPTPSPQPLSPRSGSSSPAPPSRMNQMSRFSSNPLLHRSLRIIDAQTYRFQGDLLTDSESEDF